MIDLRLARLSDYSVIAKIHADSWRQNYRGIFSDPYLDDNLDEKRSKVWYNKLKFSSQNQIVTVAISNKIIVGFSCLLIDDSSTFGSLLENLHVSVNEQKTGIGKLLMKDCAKNIIAYGNTRKMYLWVYASNLNAISFYLHLGGVNFELVEKQNEDGTKGFTYRYIWKDVSNFI